ncbi:MAG: serine/threonine-protein kinase [Planctomycetaceae bacterium]|nr:serine/threonine-protein kinase [Planctomycetaceae bacterium]
MSDADSKSENNQKGRIKAPRQIGKYELKRRLGAGGMGAVFLATDTKTKRAVALKVLPKDKAANKTLVKRFQAEAQAVANLEHENIVRVYEADQADGYLYIALEYIDGTDVDIILKKRERMPVKRAAEVVKQVAKALQHAHEQNIVHREIKPANIMIRNDGMVKLTDLGLARSVDEADDTNITRAGTTVGTVDYMAPEQARNSRLADIRSDLYSLGCTWYQMVVGHPPYHEGSLTNKLQAHSSAKLPDPRDENPDVPESTVIMIHQLMAKKPKDRYQTPQELLDDFQNSSMHRSTISNDVLSALAEEDSSLDLPRTGEPETVSEANASESYSGSSTTDSSEDPEAEQAPRRRQKQKKRDSKSSQTQQANQPPHSSRQPKMPPRQDRKDAPETSKPRGGDGDSAPLEILKYLAIAGGFVGVFVGIWYVLSAFASGLDPGGSAAKGESQRQLARDMMDENQSAPIPTAGRRQPDEENGPKPTQVTFSDPGQTSSPQKTAVTSLELIKSPSIYKAPDWANRVPVSAEIPNLFADLKLKPRTVGQWGNQLGAFRTISSALEKLPAGPVWLQLLGPGPFSLNPVTIKDRQLVISRASDDYEPSIVCLAGKLKKSNQFLKIEDGSLLLTGVNLSIDAQQFPATGPASLISMTRGNLFLRDVSVSVIGRRESPTHAISYTSSKSTPESSRILIDRSLIRGHCSSLQLAGNSNSLLVTNSLLLSAESPVFAIDSPDVTSDDNQNSTSSINVVRSTLATSHSLFVVNGKGSSMQVALEETQCFSAGSTDSPLIDLKQWAVSPTPQPSQSSAHNFRWTTNASDFRGWKTLLRSGVNAVEPITEIAVWKKFWDDSFNNSDFSTDAWTAPQPIDALSFNDKNWTDNSSSGVPTDALSLPSPSIQSTTHEMTGLSEDSPTAFSGPPPATIELNLDKTNLDDELKKTSWKSGTRFLLSGTQTDLLRPIVVEGRSLILEMAPNQPEGFDLQPRKNFSESLLTVQNASLKLINVRMRVPNRSRDSEQPAWLLNVTNGSLSVVNSHLSGPYLENDHYHYRGLIHWETGTGRSLPESQPRRHLLEISSSVLLTRGVAVSTSPQAGLVRVIDSLIAAQGTAWECQFLPNPESLSALFDFRQSTLGGSESVLSILETPQDQAGIRVAFLMRDCLSINTNPGEIRRAKTVFLAADSSWLNQQHLIWWGRANGWSTDISCFTIAPNEVGQLQTVDDWTALWGAFNVQKPLYNPVGVILAEQETRAKELLPEYFQLDPKSRALKWNLEGDPIGANLDEFLPVKTADGKPAEKQPSKARPTSGF